MVSSLNSHWWLGMRSVGPPIHHRELDDAINCYRFADSAEANEACGVAVGGFVAWCLSSTGRRSFHAVQPLILMSRFRTFVELLFFMVWALCHCPSEGGAPSMLSNHLFWCLDFAILLIFCFSWFELYVTFLVRVALLPCCPSTYFDVSISQFCWIFVFHGLSFMSLS